METKTEQRAPTGEDIVAAVSHATATGQVPPDHPHWVKYYADGGTLMAARGSRRTRGVYWSVRCEDPSQEKPTMIRKQSLEYRTNNDAEWLAVTEAMQHAAQFHTAMPIVIYSDSQLVVRQYDGRYRAKIARHHRWRDECRRLASGLTFVIFQWVPRAVNVEKLGH